MSSKRLASAMPIGPKTASVPDCIKSEEAVRRLVESTSESTMLRAVLAVVAHGAVNAKTVVSGRGECLTRVSGTAVSGQRRKFDAHCSIRTREGQQD